MSFCCCEQTLSLSHTHTRARTHKHTHMHACTHSHAHTCTTRTKTNKQAITLRGKAESWRGWRYSLMNWRRATREQTQIRWPTARHEHILLAAVQEPLASWSKLPFLALQSGKQAVDRTAQWLNIDSHWCCASDDEPMLVSGLQLFQSKAQAVHIANLSVSTQENMNVHTLGHKYPLYSLVQWNWFSVVTESTWVTCTSDVREPISLHHAVHTYIYKRCRQLLADFFNLHGLISSVLDLWQAGHQYLCPAWMPYTCGRSVRAPCIYKCQNQRKLWKVQ